jgi:hypothetical protein
MSASQRPLTATENVFFILKLFIVVSSSENYQWV